MIKLVWTSLIVLSVFLGQTSPSFATNSIPSSRDRGAACSFALGMLTMGGAMGANLLAGHYLSPEVYTAVHVSMAGFYGVLRARGSKREGLRAFSFLYSLPYSIYPWISIKNGEGRFFSFDVGKAEEKRSALGTD